MTSRSARGLLHRVVHPGRGGGARPLGTEILPELSPLRPTVPCCPLPPVPGPGAPTDGNLTARVGPWSDGSPWLGKDLASTSLRARVPSLLPGRCSLENSAGVVLACREAGARAWAWAWGARRAALSPALLAVGRALEVLSAPGSAELWAACGERPPGGCRAHVAFVGRTVGRSQPLGLVPSGTVSSRPSSDGSARDVSCTQGDRAAVPLPA